MYKHIIAATDGSERAERSLDMAFRLAKQLGSKATVITVTAPLSSITTGEAAIYIPPEDYARSVKEHSTAVLARATAIAERIGIPCETMSVNEAFPATTIVAAAKAKGCDLIVVGSHGRGGVARFFLGSETVKILSLATIPVLVHRD